MTFGWTRHRFSGGRLALDVANSVILRHDPARTIDRFAAPETFALFPAAATRFCAEREAVGNLDGHAAGSPGPLIALREAIDRNFRSVAKGNPDRHALSELLISAGTVLGEKEASPLALATAGSALKLLAEDVAERMRICRACGWLFLDQSRNRKRIWCDMAVCGNREKARRHYSNTRQKIAAQEGKP